MNISISRSKPQRDAEEARAIIRRLAEILDGVITERPRVQISSGLRRTTGQMLCAAHWRLLTNVGDSFVNISINMSSNHSVKDC